MEIVWQQLVDFNSVTVGKMIVQVSDNGLIATRGPGDATKGFGTISRKPLAGEDVLVRRLAEAVSQAIEKGLANKVRQLSVLMVIDLQNSTSLTIQFCSPPPATPTQASRVQASCSTNPGHLDPRCWNGRNSGGGTEHCRC